MTELRQCDDCGEITRGETKGWTSDEYTGRVLCPACVEKKVKR